MVWRMGWGWINQSVEARYAELSDTIEQIAHRLGHSKGRPRSFSFHTARWPIGELRTPLEEITSPSVRNVVRSADKTRNLSRAPFTDHEINLLWWRRIFSVGETGLMLANAREDWVLEKHSHAQPRLGVASTRAHQALEAERREWTGPG